MKQAKNKEQMYDQDTETCRLAFVSQKRSKRTRNKVLIKSWKLNVLVFEAINKA